MTEILAILVPALPLAVALAILATPSQPLRRTLAILGAAPTVAAALLLAVLAIARSSHPSVAHWYLIDGASGVFLAVNAVIGGLSAVLSRSYHARVAGGFFEELNSRRWYNAGLYIFWAALLSLPLLANLAAAWVDIEVTTAASALLVSYSGTRNSLEAGWKYLVLTTFGLAIALLGIVVLYANLADHTGGLHLLDFTYLAAHADAVPHTRVLFAFVLILGGLAAKIGWAPVHNWLPDAHSQAPAPVSAMLSAALLPSVMLVAWRVLDVLGPACGSHAPRDLFVAFGLLSLAVAVPFLWRGLAWKRLLAYSSLEHMGVLALGIGFGTPLALAGVVLHLAGHALAKALGFYAAIPLQEHLRGELDRPLNGLASASPGVAGSVGLTLGALGAVPPSPLFFSEVLILLGGLHAGMTVPVAAAAVLLALGFLGLAHNLIEALLGGEPRERWPATGSLLLVRGLVCVVAPALLALSALAILLPHWHLLPALMRGVSG